MKISKKNRSTKQQPIRPATPFFGKEGQNMMDNQATKESFSSDHLIQLKLTISHHGNEYDQEADAMADQVLNQTSSSALHQKCATRKKDDGALLPKLQFMKELESSFGTDFSGFRVLTGQQMNQNLNAQAFTQENYVYFNQGKYSLDTSSGRHLLAHELTHIVQQETSS